MYMPPISIKLLKYLISHTTDQIWLRSWSTNGQYNNKGFKTCIYIYIYIYNVYNQTCIKRSPLEQIKSGLLWQVTSQ